MSDRATIAALKGIVDGTGILPAAMQDFLADRAPAASVQLLPGDRWTERYVDGSGTREIPFAVLYRTGATDSNGRVDAAADLIELADALEALTVLPANVTGIEGAGSPYLFERTPDTATGTSEVWRASFVLTLAVS